jgi:hypothetical protein
MPGDRTIGDVGEALASVIEGLARERLGFECPVRLKVAVSGVRLQWTLQCPELGCESLPGSGLPPVNNVGL